MSTAFRLGVFIVGTLLVLAAGVFQIGSKEFLFSSTYTIRSDFQNVGGLDDGAQVRVGGIPEGTVKHIVLPKRPDGKVTVVMNLQRATQSVLKKDSVASIKSEGLLGDKYVEISFGSDQAQGLKSGDSIASARSVDISDLIEKTDNILASTETTMQNMQGATDNLKSISTKIDQGQGTVGALINDKTMYRDASAGAAAFQDNMEALKHNFLLRGFFKKRGYEDSDELAKHAVARLPAEPVSKKFSFDAAQLFDKPDSSKLKNKKLLNEVGQFLEGNKFRIVVVVARGGVKGDTDKIRELTNAQASVVRGYLVDNFRLDDTRIKTSGLGKAQNENENHKVEVLVYPAGNPSVAEKAR
jgi:phospholipid/cholesterol/gamma-HCH transport system substrate-binding protein